MKPTESAPCGDELLRPDIAARLIGITPDTLRRWANDGVLPTQRVRPGSHRRYRRSDVEALIARNSGTATQEVADAS